MVFWKGFEPYISISMCCKKLCINFMAANSIEWSWCVGLCTDGAAAMTGKRTGLWERVRSKVPTATFTHCMIHRESLASKRMNADYF